MAPNFPLPPLVRENRDQLIEQLMAENAALCASRDQQALEAAQIFSMAHASGASAAQISATAEAEIRRTREQSESVLLQQQQGLQTDAHRALEQVNTLWRSTQAQHRQEPRHVTEQAVLQQQHQLNTCKAIQSEAERMRGELYIHYTGPAARTAGSIGRSNNDRSGPTTTTTSFDSTCPWFVVCFAQHDIIIVDFIGFPLDYGAGYAIRNPRTATSAIPSRELFSHMGDYRLGDATLNKSLADLPVWTLPRNWTSQSSAELQTILETWLSRLGLVVATWHTSGTDFWRDIHGQARQRHAACCNAPIQQRVGLEHRFSFGQQMPILAHLSNFETMLRQKLPGAIPTSDILFYILGELVPFDAHARVSMTEEIQSSLKTPTTLTALAEFMESWLTKLHVGLQLGVHLEPMNCLAVLKHASSEVGSVF
eukprot:2965545-Amphidinium_carterae.1